MGRDNLSKCISDVVDSFNPRARMGRDYLSELGKIGGSSFNPRARMGRDAEVVDRKRKLEQVSIHAPAWGATSSDSR